VTSPTENTQFDRMDLSMFHKRQGQMLHNQVYFYTDTIIDFKHLLGKENMKLIVIDSLKYLVDQKWAEIYGYVIMPNHIHLLWNILNYTRKESVAGSFSKFTAHQFKKYLQASEVSLLQNFQSDKADRMFQFWKRDPLAIPISNEHILIDKLNYIHNNPIKDKWKLAILPEDYRFSSASFYKYGKDEFGFLTHVRG
jgi:REP element-mobilizing transposase RayT